jgi:hypothetical protein
MKLGKNFTQLQFLGLKPLREGLQRKPRSALAIARGRSCSGKPDPRLAGHAQIMEIKSIFTAQYFIYVQ